MQNYTLNLATQTITITKAFEAEMLKGNTEEFNLIMNLKSINPNFKIAYRTHKAPRSSNKNKHLSYENMERFIKVYSNSEELLKRFNEVKEMSVICASPYNYVKNWFTTQFPDYKQAPETIDKTLCIKVIPAPCLEDYKKKVA